MLDNETRKLMKLLHLQPDEIYHVFCLALCMGHVDGKITDEEGEVLTRIGFGLGLSPEDIEVLGENARSAIAESGVTDVVSFSVAKLKTKLEPEQLQGIKQILQFVANSDRHLDTRERTLLSVMDEIWAE